MEEIERILGLAREIGINIEKNTFHKLYGIYNNMEIEIRVSKSKPKSKNQKRITIVISPFVAKKIDKETLRKIIEEYKQPIFINKNSLEKILPSNLFRIVAYLKENPNSYIKKISEDLKIHPEIVRRNLLKIKDYLEIRDFSNSGINLPKLPKLITLKKEIPEEKLKELASQKVSIVKSNRKRKTEEKYEKIDRKEAIYKILKFIELNPGTYLREISRELKINPSLVYSCLKEVSQFLDLSSPIGIEDLELPKLPISIKIKEGYTAEGILRYLKFKEILKK